MLDDLARDLRGTVEDAVPRLSSITETDASSTRAGRVWTRKQELGHLIDSSLNNHMRFVRAALDGVYAGPGYEQNRWVDLHDYASLEWSSLVSQWAARNELLVRVVERIPGSALGTACSIGDSAPVSLEYLIADYIRHLRHHLAGILS